MLVKEYLHKNKLHITIATPSHRVTFSTLPTTHPSIHPSLPPSLTSSPYLDPRDAAMWNKVSPRTHLHIQTHTHRKRGIGREKGAI